MKKLMGLTIFALVNAYGLDFYAPFKGGTSQTLTQNYDGTGSHGGAGEAYALDFAGAFNIYAPADGIVEYAGVDKYMPKYCQKKPSAWHPPGANYVRIKHTDGTYSYYYHLSEINVKKDDKVEQGKTIVGVSGNTGCSTNNHLHIQFAKTASMSRSASYKVTFKDIGLPKALVNYTSGNYPSNTPTPTKTLKYIQPYCPKSWMTVGDTQSCTAKAYYSDNSIQDITSSASWSVMTNPSALKVASGGKVTALGAEKNIDSKIRIDYSNITPNSVIVNVEGVDGKNPTTYKSGSCFQTGNYSRWLTSIPNGTLYLYYSKTCKSNIGYLIPNTTSSKTSVKIVRDDGSTQSYSGTGRIYTPMLYAPSKKVCVHGSVNGANWTLGSCY